MRTLIAKTFRRAIYSATLAYIAPYMTGCGHPSDGPIETSEVVEIGRDLTDRLETAQMPAEYRAFFTASAKSVRTNFDRVEQADSVGYGDKWPIRRLAGYSLWTALLEDASLAKRGISVDASRAVDACLRMGVLECDLKGWEEAYAPPPSE